MKNTFRNIKITEQARQIINFGCFQFYFDSLAVKTRYPAMKFFYLCTQRVYKHLELISVAMHSFHRAKLLRKVYRPVAARLVGGAASLHMYTCQSGPEIFKTAHRAPHILLFYAMAGRAKSDVDKAYAQKRVYEALMVRAVAAYKEDQRKPKRDRRGYRKICLDFECYHFAETGKYINSILNDIQFIF